jgi:hypothetical protein
MAAFDRRPGAAPGPAKRAAPHVVDLPVSAWSDKFEKKPTVTIKVGLRMIPDGDKEAARAWAAKAAWRSVPEPRDEEIRIEAYNDALILWIVACATCQPADVLTPFWRLAQDQIPEQLTTQGIRFLFDAYEKMVLEESPLGGEATAGEFASLGAMLSDAAIVEAIVTNSTRATRRHLHQVLVDLRDAFGFTPDVEPLPMSLLQ